jgi:hypothetical protein
MPLAHTATLQLPPGPHGTTELTPQQQARPAKTMHSPFGSIVIKQEKSCKYRKKLVLIGGNIFYYISSVEGIYWYGSCIQQNVHVFF